MSTSETRSDDSSGLFTALAVGAVALGAIRFLPSITSAFGGSDGGPSGSSSVPPTRANTTTEPVDTGAGVDNDRPSEASLDDVTPSENPGMTPTYEPTYQQPPEPAETTASSESSDSASSRPPQTRANTTTQPTDPGRGGDRPSEANLDDVTQSDSSTSSSSTQDDDDSSAFMSRDEYNDVVESSPDNNDEEENDRGSYDTVAEGVADRQQPTYGDDDDDGSSSSEQEDSPGLDYTDPITSGIP